MPHVQKRMPPMWRCPVCSRRFANRNQSHACGRHKLKPHFERASPAVVNLYRAFARFVRQCGPVMVLPEKTRIAFQVRMSFAAVALRSTRLVGHLVLDSRQPQPFISRIETFSPRNHVHYFSLTCPEDFSPAFARLVRSAYRVGQQKHLR